ncbi:MAG: Outer rane component of tripartite multidrug resistance system [Herbaspirillum sp.]|jgi:multidrug efflux system outer membrane protein|nr:Outer rane component of tripartite multidrug resistance system [Herbaspirillum sp.]
MQRWNKARSRFTRANRSETLLEIPMAHSRFQHSPLCAVCAGLLVAALVAGLAGCAPMPPEQQALPQRDLAGAQLAKSIRLARDGWPDAQWWTAYGDPQLNALMTQALRDAPTLQTAATRLGAAHSALQEQRAVQGLSVDLDASANRQRYSGTGLFPAPIGGSIYNEATLQLKAQYDFDWWGLHRAQIAAAVGEVNARQAEYAQAERTLSGAVAQSYFALQADWASLDNLRRQVETRQALLNDSQRRVAQGLAAIDLQRRAEVELAEAERQSAATEAQAGREREALRALLGADANALADLKPRPLPPAPAALPSSLGIELLARRPDLQAARWRVQASLSRIDAAQAAFYPSINLTAVFGQDSLSFRNLMDAGSRTFFIGPALSLPIFDSGRLQARLGSERNARDAMIAEYNQTVVDAVREVAQEGVSLQGLERQQAQQTLAEQADSRMLDGARRKFHAGLAARDEVLDAQMALLQQQALSLQLQGRQLDTDVALIKALGGGYRHAPETSPAAPADHAQTPAASGAS